MTAQQKIAPCLWFDGNAEEAVKFYTSIFDDSKILGVSHYGEFDKKREGSVLTIDFQLFGQRFMALNGGSEFKFNEAISLMVRCDTQEQIDRYWRKLLEGGGNEIECGWLKDKFGLAWQVVPSELPELLNGDPQRANRVMEAVLKMKKLDIARLRQAYEKAA
jgi:predicted 3-demethylubiquinone-9 3-methyltransferase (glyoxalase superfamily)